MDSVFNLNIKKYSVFTFHLWKKKEKKRKEIRMQSFLAKWNGQECTVQTPVSNTINDLKERVMQEFGLNNCKIVGIKRKQTSLKDDNCKLVDCLLQPLQKILIIGSKEKIAHEEIKMAHHAEIHEEEIHYERILELQQNRIWGKVQHVNALKNSNITRTLSTIEKRRIVKVLCHEGDIQTLQKFWEPDLKPDLQIFAKFALRALKYNIIQFLQTKGELDYDNLFVKACKYGYLDFVIKVYDEVSKNVPTITLWVGLQYSIRHAHLHVAKWLHAKHPTYIPDQICLHDPCRRGYERTVKWYLVTFNTSLPKIYFEDAINNHHVKLLEILFEHCECDQTTLDDLMSRNIHDHEGSKETLVLLCAKGANIDIHNGSMLMVAATRNRFPILQYVVECMQQKRGYEEWSHIFSTESLRDVFVACLPRAYSYRNDKDDDMLVAMYLLEQNTCDLVKNCDYLHQKLTKFEMVALRKVLQTRVEKEEYAEFIARQIAKYVIDFPIDVNRLVLEYFIGSGGLYTKKYQREKLLFEPKET